MHRYDTFWARFWAINIDGFIINIVLQVFKIFPTSESSLIAFLLTMLAVNIPYLYAVLMLGKYGQTIGKMVMKVKVVDKTTEDRLSYFQSFMREAVPIFLVNTVLLLNYILFSDIDVKTFNLSVLGYVLLYLPLGMVVIWSVLEIVTMLFDEKNRALHDKIADTVVIKSDYY